MKSYLRELLRQGMVLPAHPLALTSSRRLDERHQRALTRYYLAAGSGGLAIGVHTTQFEIHDPEVGLYQPVLELAKEEIDRFEQGQSKRRIIRVAGIVGDTEQALREAALAHELRYDCGLVSLGALRKSSDTELVEHVRRISEIIPVFGFYLQPAVGGRILGYEFWRSLVEIEQVVAIKIAPFNRYQTLDVVRALAESGRDDLALYTGNDDAILLDLLTSFRFSEQGREIRIVGGLLGHWAVWTRKAVELFERTREARRRESISTDLLTLNAQVTDVNAAIFDPQNQFAGCIPGIHEILRRQGLLEGRWCLNPAEELSPGQMEEIDRVYAGYPHLNDDRFVQDHLDEWLR